jgi:hypothetical protein
MPAQMKHTNSARVFDRLITSLGDCLTPESARRFLALQADADLQARVADLADRHREGRLTAEEQAEYARYVSFSTFVALLKSKARQLLANGPGA